MNNLNSVLIEGEVRALGAFYKEPNGELNHFFEITVTNSSGSLLPKKFPLTIQATNKLAETFKAQIKRGDIIRVVGKLSKHESSLVILAMSIDLKAKLDGKY